MTTQSVVCYVSGVRGGRSLAVTSTDGTWNNQATTTTGSAQLGFAMTGRTINCVSVLYTAGSCVWRIRNRVTQQTKAFGFGAKVGSSGGAADTLSGGGFPPIQLAQDDVLEIYSSAVA